MAVISARSIYDRAPLALQNVAISLAGYAKNRERYGDVYWGYRKFLADFETWPLEEKLAYQFEQLKELLSYTRERSPFYRELYRGIDLDSFSSVDDLARLPIVDKEDLRSNIDRVVTVEGSDVVEAHTGGTTGKSLVTMRTVEDNMRKMATLDHFKAKHGFEHFRMKRATFNGKHIVPPGRSAKTYWRYNAACKQMIYSSFHITEQNLGRYVESLNRFKPDALDGFFMSLCDVANYIERHGIELRFKPVAIFPTSETLTPAGRELLERVFGCKVYDQYSSSEAAPFVTECAEQVLHIDLASGVFEHLEPGSDEILVTSFTSHGTPLIRYRIGDSMVFGDQDHVCRCGDASPTVAEIRGRRLDFLYNVDGAKISAAHVANLFKDVPNSVIQVQAVQDRMDHVDLHLVVDRRTYGPDHEQIIKDAFQYTFGPSTDVSIQVVDEIPREASGKFRLVVNRVAAASAAGGNSWTHDEERSNGDSDG